jgi:hypothetical protein
MSKAPQLTDYQKEQLKRLVLDSIMIRYSVATTNSTITTSWKLKGDYFERCNCKPTHPCIFKEDLDERYCNVPAIIIESGFSIS